MKKVIMLYDRVSTRVRRALAREDGATFLEYAMLCALIGIGVAAAVALLGEELKNLFESIVNSIRGVN